MNLKKRCSTLLVCAVTLASLAIANLPSLTVSAQEPTEIVSKRTAYEKHYDNHDGTTTALIHSTPLHYLDDGEWRDINNTLMPGQDNNYVNTSNSMKVSLPKSTQLKTYSDKYPSLCDQNIHNHAAEGDYSSSPEVRYYTITKNVHLYNSWHGNGHFDASTGTPYRPQ